MTLYPSDSTGSVKVDLDHAVLALSDALDFIGVDEIGHGHRVALMAAACAKAMDWSADDIHTLVQAALLHDCGVSSTREHRVLVNEITWDGAHLHCERGFAYLGSVPTLARFAPIILEHHTPWRDLLVRGVDAATARQANLIYLSDRADALHAHGLAEGKPICEVLTRYGDLHFAPDLLGAFIEQAEREAFWYAQEDPTLRERVRALALGGQSEALTTPEVKALASMFGRIIDAKSPFTERHSRGVATVSRRLGAQFGLSDQCLDLLEVAAHLHDIGKLRIPDELLEKQGPLTADERHRMARHAFDTYEILHHIFGDEPVALWAAYHHEYVSGSGYPFHPEAQDLPLEARIIAVADVLQALAQKRPYRQPMTPEEAMGTLRGMVFSGKLDGDVVGRVVEDFDAYWKAAVAPEGEVPAS